MSVSFCNLYITGGNWNKLMAEFDWQTLETRINIEISRRGNEELWDEELNLFQWPKTMAHITFLDFGFSSTRLREHWNTKTQERKRRWIGKATAKEGGILLSHRRRLPWRRRSEESRKKSWQSDFERRQYFTYLAIELTKAILTRQTLMFLISTSD